MQKFTLRSRNIEKCKDTGGYVAIMCISEVWEEVVRDVLVREGEPQKTGSYFCGIKKHAVIIRHLPRQYALIMITFGSGISSFN